MALTNERAEMLANYFAENESTADQFDGLSVNEAVEKINADGLDITVEEFEEFAEAVDKMSGETGELSEDSLDDVSGGLIRPIWLPGLWVGPVVRCVVSKIRR
jgi:lipoate-protein ligase A